MHTCTKIYCY